MSEPKRVCFECGRFLDLDYEPDEWEARHCLPACGIRRPRNDDFDADELGLDPEEDYDA